MQVMVSDEIATEAEAFFRKAQAALSRSNHQAAHANVDRALELAPSTAKNWHLKADILIASRQLEAAKACLASAIANLRSADTEACLSLQVHLSSLLVKEGDLGAARAVLDTDLVAATEQPELAARAGYLLALCEDHAAALSAFERARANKQNDPELLFNSAAALRALGRLEEAEHLYDQVITLAPDYYPAYWLRSGLQRQTKNNHHIEQMQTQLQATHTREGKVQLYFSLAKELEDLQRYRESFSALDAGCRLQQAHLQYQPDSDIAAIEAMTEAWSRPPPSADEQLGEGVVFILGMPRTGSTLVDRLLSAHAGVESAGEPETFGQLFYRHAGLLSPSQPFDQIALIRNSPKINFAALGREYLELMARRTESSANSLLIDKNPANYLYLGAIRAALPAAKILHICRDPMDTCYAILKTLFRSSATRGAHPYSYNQVILAQYYSAYRRLMHHWQHVYAGGFLNVHYESLTDRPSQTGRQVFEFCRLEWQEDYLKFYQMEGRGTATASAAQVRRPINRASRNLWKNHQENLAPIKAILEDADLLAWD